MEPIKTDWHWSQGQEQAFPTYKKLVIQTPILVHYDPNKALSTECEASETGPGAALLEYGRPREYASRALTSPEQTRYAQIDKECLAIVFALTKFHQCPYLRKTTLQSHHKPLEMIAQKPLYKTLKRLQGSLLHILQYDTETAYKQV